MTNIMEVLVGKEFGRPFWRLEFSSPYGMFLFVLEDSSPPYPSKKLSVTEVKSLRDYLTVVLDGHHKIEKDMDRLNG